VILGIGIDVVVVSRFKKWENNQDLLERFFDSRELAAVQDRGKGMLRSLAARFAAKEAFGKALGTGLTGLALKDIMVLNRADERPSLCLEGSALRAMNAAGAKSVHVSLSHDGDIAAAFVVLEA
jgi:holo-[acyl-carrier protein] synthase